MPADIVLFAIIAVVLILWLRNIVGMKDESDEERKKPNPYSDKYQLPGKPGKTRKPIKLDQPDEAGEEALDLKPVRGPENHPNVDNKTAEAGLVKISIADKSFDVENFLGGAKKAFEIIVRAFASADRDTLKDLLAESVYDAFESVIAEREKKGHEAETTIHSIDRADIIAAKIKGTEAMITVRFTATESHIIRDKDGKAVYGNSKRKDSFTDVWVFSRDVKSDDPKWLLAETYDDEEELYEKTQIPEAK